MLRLAAMCMAFGATVICAAAAPASLVLGRGRVLYGTNSLSIDGGSLAVSDGRLACFGRYLPPGDMPTFTLTMTCNDGRVGVSVIERDSTTGGHGRMFFTRGPRGRLSFGG